MRIVGLMSGSSLDGIDLVSVIFSGGDIIKWTLEEFETVEIPPRIKNSLKSIVDQSIFEFAETESTYTKFISNSLNDFTKKLSEPPVCAGIHGHTVLHLPEIQTSWQLLNGGMCAALTGIDILCDFRNNDMSLGGQGTPMAVLADRDLFPGFDYYINMGGIVNISIKNENEWLAYDIAPCNQVSNYLAQQKGLDYDKNGQLAQNGVVNQSLLHELLNDPFIKKEPPKSLDNSWIRNYWLPKILSFNLSVEDYLKTHNAFIIKIIKAQITKLSGKILLTGGGAKNKYFLELFKEEIGKHYICSDVSNEIIDYKESILMAYLAYLRFNNEPNFIKSATGARLNSTGGAWYSSKRS